MKSEHSHLVPRPFVAVVADGRDIFSGVVEAATSSSLGLDDALLGGSVPSRYTRWASARRRRVSRTTARRASRGAREHRAP